MDFNSYYFPLHLDAGNRGCEAIARGTITILGLKNDKYIALSRNIENDYIVDLDKIVSYKNNKKSIINKVIYRLAALLGNKEEEYNKYVYKKYLEEITCDDITLITGGDMLCYGNNEINYIVDKLFNENKKIVLWGCSFSENNFTIEKYNALKRIDYITARESLTFNYLFNELGLKNTIYAPDPAFVLEPQRVEIENYFENDCVGINISNFVDDTVNTDTLAGKNVIRLIDYILDETEMEIVFIPHVFWKGQDDRTICESFLKYYKNNLRVHCFESEKYNYCQLRYVISKCRFFVGSRTHAMISAYYSCVPSIALGYSVKSKGIGKDLCMPDYSILNYKNLKGYNDLLDSFINLSKEEKQVRHQLSLIMPSYIKKAYNAKKVFELI